MQPTIQLTYSIEPEDDRFVATCVELDLSSFGPTVEAAARQLDNAVQLYLEVLEEDGERERLFRERGIQATPAAAPSEPPRAFITVRRVALPA
jgi:predicted RNase H-like HicB family nuclease